MDLQLTTEAYPQIIHSVDPEQMIKWIKVSVVIGIVTAFWVLNSAVKRARVATRITRVRLRRFLEKNG